MSDVINMARAGTPGVGLITERFAEEADFVATSLGMPDAPWTELPYPVAGSGDESMRALATAVIPTLIDSLRGAR